MEKIFNRPEEMRQLASKEQIVALKKYFLSAPSKEWGTEDCPYGFSRTSASNLLDEFGVMDDKTLDISFKKPNTKQVTLYLTDDVIRRLNNLYAQYDGISKQNVLDAFMRKSLDNMGV